MEYRTPSNTFSISLLDQDYTGKVLTEYQDSAEHLPHKEPLESSIISSPLESLDHPSDGDDTQSLPAVLQGSWTRIARANITVDLFANLVRLGRSPPGWRGPGSKALRARSVSDFLEFWLLVSDVAVEPELALAPDGSLHAEWFKPPRRKLDIRFADQKLMFGLFTDNSVLEGSEPLRTVAQILKWHRAKPLSWRAK